MVRHACLVRQGVWTHWEDVRPFDLSWKNLIYGPGPKVIAFVLNTQINSVNTPDMLKLWRLTTSAHCPLCAHNQCTLPHPSQLQVCFKSVATLGATTRTCQYPGRSDHTDC